MYTSVVKFRTFMLLLCVLVASVAFSDDDKIVIDGNSQRVTAFRHVLPMAAIESTRAALDSCTYRASAGLVRCSNHATNASDHSAMHLHVVPVGSGAGDLIGSDMQWLWPADAAAITFFDELFDQLDIASRLATLAPTGSLRLMYGHFISRSHSAATRLHVDWIPETNGKAFTLITPLVEMATLRDFHLSYRRRVGDAGFENAQYRYLLGEAVIFRDHFHHGTEAGVAPNVDGRVAPGVSLLSLTFGDDSMNEREWAAAESSLELQTAFYRDMRGALRSRRQLVLRDSLHDPAGTAGSGDHTGELTTSGAAIATALSAFLGGSVEAPAVDDTSPLAARSVDSRRRNAASAEPDGHDPEVGGSLGRGDSGPPPVIRPPVPVR